MATIVLNADQKIPADAMYSNDVYVQGGQCIGRGWSPHVAPWRVTFVSDDSSPGLHGWSSRSYTFATLDQALAVAAMMMDKFQRKVEVDVATNRKTWSTNGCWTPVGSRNKAAKGKSSVWRWAKGWNPSRVAEVAEWYKVKQGIE